MKRNCRYCKKELNTATRTEKALRCCKACAEEAREVGFGEMAKGNLKKGLIGILEMTGLKSTSISEDRFKAAAKSKLAKKMIKRNMKKLEKKLKKEGHSEEEIKKEIKKQMDKLESSLS